MKLYLSSYHLGDNPEEFAKLFLENKKVAVISNALDFIDESYRKESTDRQINALREIKLLPEELDLRNYFNAENLEEKVNRYGGLWVKGGNTFILRRAMTQSGLDKIILQKNSNSDFVYGGYSAGICVLGPTLHGIDLVDNPNEVPKGYNPEIIWEGLGIIDYSIVPHYKSTHPESFKVDESLEYFIKNKIPNKTLRDGEVIIIN
jgi:dipeptidase E